MRDVGMVLFMLAGIVVIIWGIREWCKDMRELEAEWELDESQLNATEDDDETVAEFLQKK